jgi:putative transposase
MNKEALEAFAIEAAKTIKTEEDLNSFRQMLTKVTIERALNCPVRSDRTISLLIYGDIFKIE